MSTRRGDGVTYTCDVLKWNQHAGRGAQVFFFLSGFTYISTCVKLKMKATIGIGFAGLSCQTFRGDVSRCHGSEDVDWGLGPRLLDSGWFTMWRCGGLKMWLSLNRLSLRCALFCPFFYGEPGPLLSLRSLDPGSTRQRGNKSLGWNLC